MEDYIKKFDNQAERRFTTGTVELRAGEGEGKKIRGYAAKFNTLSEDFGGFRERIAPGFFDDVLADDVRALFNHDSNLILARSKSGTLKIGVDDTGLWYEYDHPETSYSMDLSKSLKRGDVNQSSFAFVTAEDSWDEIDNATVRTLVKAKRLLDVSPVTYPAYPDTSVSSRAFEKIKKETEQPDLSEVHALKDYTETKSIKYGL